VIFTESGGDETVISSQGAVGLMQVMPRDGIAASFYCGDNPCFKNRPTINELLNPEFNVKYGSRMLINLIEGNEGSERWGLRLYGPMDYGFIYADKVLAVYNRIKT